ncbi:unnamed protein product [Closterium sp. NIES-54]
MSKVLIAEGLGYNLLSLSQLMAKGIHLEADSTTQEFKLYHGRDGLYIGRAVLKNNVFVLDFVPDLGTADSDAIVNFTDWTHPPDLNPDFSLGGFWYSHTIPEAERTRPLATIQQTAAAETTSAAAETTLAAAETTLAAAETTSAAAETTSAAATTLAAAETTTPVIVEEEPPTPAQQLNPTQREVHRSANFVASFYSNSDAYQRSPGHRASEEIWPARTGHPSNTLKSFQSDGGGEYTSQRFKQYLAERGIKQLLSLPYTHQQQGVAERMNRTLQNSMRKLLRGMRLPNHQSPAAMDHAVMLHNLLSSSSLPNNASPHLLWTGKQGSTKMLRVFGCMVQYRPPEARAGRFSQRAQWGLHLGIEKKYNAWRIFDVHTKETVAARDVIFYERLTLQMYLANLHENRDLTGTKQATTPLPSQWCFRWTLQG